MLGSAPITVRFTITDDDIDVLRRFRPGRMRPSELEGWIFFLMLVPDLGVGVAWYFLGARFQRTIMGLIVLAALWTLLLGTSLYLLLHRSPSSKAWFKRLVQMPVLNVGECTATIHPDSRLDLVTPNRTISLAQNDLGSCVHSLEYFYITTMGGQAIIIPKRAFASFDQWVEFIRKVQTTA